MRRSVVKQYEGNPHETGKLEGSALCTHAEKYNTMAAAPLEVVLHSLELNREGHYKLNVTVFSTNGERHFRRVSLSSVSYFEPTSAALESVDPVTEANCTLNLVPRSKASRRDTPVFITLDILERTPSLEHDLRITQVQIDLQIRKLASPQP